MISLSICTYNRSDSLRETLDSVCSLNDRERLTEVLIVDNNSTDATAAIVASYASKLPIRRVLETAQGLSYARNRAVKEFKGEILLFTDDDVCLDVDWLSGFFKAAGQFSNAQYFGGRILPKWEDQPPRWFKNERLALLDGVLVWYDYGTEIRRYSPQELTPFGASFAVRRSLLEGLGDFRTDLGRVGIQPGRGEETEFLQRAVARGVQGVYVGEALVWHKVDPRRLRVIALYRHGVACGRAHALMTQMYPSRGLLRIPIHIVRGLGQLVKRRGDRFRQCVINVGIEVGKRDAELAARHAEYKHTLSVTNNRHIR